MAPLNVDLAMLVGGYYLQVLWLLGFVPMSVGTILFWEGEDEKISSCNTDNDPVSQ